MKMSDGVEWAAHACAVLAATPHGRALSAEALAAFHELPKAYMAKHMQALARAGVVAAVRGAGGGYRLARPADQISLWDIRVAIEGPGPDFQCKEIRFRGPCPSHSSGRPCSVAKAFWNAERAYQDQARAVSIADIVATIAAGYGEQQVSAFVRWVDSVS